MAIIETEVWKPNPDRPGTLIFDSSRMAQDVFDDLKAHLTAIGRMPDEYFSLWMDWENGKLFPKDATLTCQVSFGGSEGIYLDISIAYKKDMYEHSRETGELGWHNRTVVERFATGKTLGESNDDLDRMNLIASSVTAAFYGYQDGVHARYVAVNCVVGGSEPKSAKHAELYERLEKNLADYHETLMGFGKRELIEMAGKINAMSDAYCYMTTYHEFSDGELDFYLQLKNPLGVVADMRNEIIGDLDDMSFSMNTIFDQCDDYLTYCELIGDTSAQKPEKQQEIPEQTDEEPKTLQEKLQAAGEKAKAQDAHNKNKSHKREERE